MPGRLGEAATVGGADPLALDVGEALARPRRMRIVRARPRESGSVVSRVRASSSTACGGRSATPCDASVRHRSTGSPPAPLSSSSADHAFRHRPGRTCRSLRDSPLDGRSRRRRRRHLHRRRAARRTASFGPPRCRPRRGRRSRSLAAAAAVGAAEVERFTHGTTVATNALLERKGARTAFVATAGFEHLLHLRRQNRAHLYRLCAAHPEPLVPLERCHGVRERIGPDGVLEPLELDSLPRARRGRRGGRRLPALLVPRSLARARGGRGAAAPAARRARRRLARARRPSSASTSGPRRRRSTPTSGRRSRGYLEALAGACGEAGLPEPLVMRSSGGLATLAEAAAHPAVALVSGPAAGVVGAAAIARLAGVEDAITFDMGGTSTDVCADRRRPRPAAATEREVGRLAAAAADGRPADRRRRRRLDRLARRRRRAARRPGERRRRSGAGLLRARAARGRR